MKRLIGSVALILCVIFLFGCSGLSMEAYNSVIDENANLKTELDKYKADYASIKDEYEKYLSDTADWITYSESEKKSALEVAERQSEIADLESEKINLEKTISQLETQIANLQADVVKLKGEPKSYPAGYLYAGKDFAVGRYKIYDGNSNFVVYSSDGRLRVNEILGDKYGVSDYICKFAAADEVKAGSAFKMVPIE
ncbi:MAG: hypothetical protein ACYCX2_01745 [Christensenellales bacterium]